MIEKVVKQSSDFLPNSKMLIFGGGFSGGGFGDIFGGGARRRQKNGGGNLKISIPLTLEEIFSGTSKKIKIKRWEKTNATPSKCSKCSGTGEIRQVQRSFLGQIVNVQECNYCSGIGYVGGREKKTVTINVDIPAGVAEGNYMTLSGEGDKSIQGDNNGDLIVFFEEKEHTLYTRKGNDLFVDCFINFPENDIG